MQHNWLLLETLGSEPLVVADGQVPTEPTPVSTYLRRSPHLSALQTAIAETVTTGSPLASITPKQKAVIRTEPTAMGDGRVHGVQLWVGALDEDPPERPIPGPLLWNLTTGVAIDSPAALANRGEDPDAAPVHARAFADDLPIGSPRAGETRLLALILNRTPGETLCENWHLVDRYGASIAVAFVARVVEEEAEDGSMQLIGRGMNWRSDPHTVTDEPETLAERILEGLAMPGQRRALIDLHTGTLLKWLDPPFPGYDWRTHTVHPDDQEALYALADELGPRGTSRVLRMATYDGGWLPVHITLNRIEIEPGIFVGLLTLRDATPCDEADPPEPTSEP